MPAPVTTRIDSTSRAKEIGSSARDHLRLIPKDRVHTEQGFPVKLIQKRVHAFSLIKRQSTDARTSIMRKLRRIARSDITHDHMYGFWC